MKPLHEEISNVAVRLKTQISAAAATSDQSIRCQHKARFGYSITHWMFSRDKAFCFLAIRLFSSVSLLMKPLHEENNNASEDPDQSGISYI